MYISNDIKNFETTNIFFLNFKNNQKNKTNKIKSFVSDLTLFHFFLTYPFFCHTNFLLFIYCRYKNICYDNILNNLYFPDVFSYIRHVICKLSLFNWLSNCHHALHNFQTYGKCHLFFYFIIFSLSDHANVISVTNLECYRDNQWE